MVTLVERDPVTAAADRSESAAPAEELRDGVTDAGPESETTGEQDAAAERLLAAAAMTPARRLRTPKRALTLAVLLDVCVVAVAAAIARSHVGDAIAVGVLLLVVRAGIGLYRSRLMLSAIDEIPLTVRSTSLVFGVSGLLLSWRDDAVDVSSWVMFFVSFLIGITIARAIAFAVLRRIRRSGPGRRRRTLVLGAGFVGDELVGAMRAHPEQGMEPVGFIDSDVPDSRDGPQVPVLRQDETRLEEALTKHRVDTIVVAYGAFPDARLIDSIIQCVRHGCEIYVVPRLFELQHDGPDVERLQGLPLVRLRTDVTSSPLWLLKLAIDRACAAVALLLLSPVMIALSVAVVLDSGRPVLFKQERVGFGGQPITLFKFRSMRPANEHESQTNWNIAGDMRLTKVGRFIRKTSLDELPQLLNILRGDMSLVGPRPERKLFVEQFSREHDRYWARHRVPVGLTGWSQVSGLRGDTSIHLRARYDNYYISNWSPWLDTKILLLTLREVLRGSGA